MKRFVVILPALLVLAVFVSFSQAQDKVPKSSSKKTKAEQEKATQERNDEIDDFFRRTDRTNRSGRTGQRTRRGGGRIEENSLIVGEMAPEFVLKSLDGKSETKLDEFAGKKPVILFFGSYT